jgi:hypothetical protein
MLHLDFLSQQSGPAARSVRGSQQVYHANNLQRQSVRWHDKFGRGLWPVDRGPHAAFPEPAFAEAYARPTGCEGLQLPASSIWIMRNGAPAYSITLPTIPIEWQVAGAADLLGTGQADLI